MPPIATHSTVSCDSSRGRDALAGPYEGTIDVEACRRYVLGCQTSQGGFCFYAYPEWGVEEPNAPDTYAALAILGLLNSPVPRAEQCQAWLEAEQDPSGGYPTLVIGYAALKALRVLGAEPQRDPRPFLQEMANRLGLADASAPKRSGWLIAARRCIELWQAHGIIMAAPLREGIGAALDSLRGVDGGYGAPGSNLSETAAALTLATAADLPVGQDILAYARRCEGTPYGFNITPFSVSSSLESHYAGLEILRYFGMPVRNPMLSRRYVASCQSSRGGFGRVPGAIARLDDSLRALEILSMLAALVSLGLLGFSI
jgi:hypothetical protein